jgi:hypothetical protein
MPEKRGKMRKIANDGDGTMSEPIAEKKQRKKWTAEETQMLVDGCNTVSQPILVLSRTFAHSGLFQWGVGNWKAILKDPKLKFDHRSPVDLKDRWVSIIYCPNVSLSYCADSRFRTYFPDAYKQHYPNAKTHLSSKVRSTLPDGRSIFEKTRSKKRRPFTEDEDRALKAGYEKHGTVWATIVKDPVFQEQNRRSTDLRDRFRNAFPDLYQAAGYKPRNASKKKRREDGSWLPARAATDDQLGMGTTAGPVRRRRAQTTHGLFRGGTKSVPESTTCSEDEDSSGGEEESGSPFKKPAPIMADHATPQPEEQLSSCEPFPEMEMYTIDQLSDPLHIPDFTPNSSQPISEIADSAQSWAHLDNSIHSNAWSSATTAGSPTSSHISSDYFLNQSPFNRRSNGMDMIGKSAWGTQDWFSPNPRLDPSGASSSSSSFVGGLSPAPSSPFSFQNLNHGVVDRYDLFPTTMPHDFASEAGMGDNHSTFSDPEMFPPSSFRGFTHHSNYAGDLIFGARSQQHQPTSYGSGFGFGTQGLGLQGMQQSAGIHPMQLHAPALPGIDEIELASITLNDHVNTPHEPMDGSADIGEQKDDNLHLYTLDSQSLDDIVDLSQELHITPPATPLTSTRTHRPTSALHHTQSVAHHSRSLSVPPGEFRSNSGSGRPSQIHANSQPHMARPLPHSDISLSHDTTSNGHPVHGQNSMPPSSYAEPWRQSHPNELYDLPFLDLHYYYGNNSMGPGYDTADLKFDSEQSRQGQALDLAQSASSLKTPGPPPSAASNFTHMSQTFGDTGRSHATHHRRQSAVSPQDLLLRKGSDNKRKRASWDGGVC